MGSAFDPSNPKNRKGCNNQSGLAKGGSTLVATLLAIEGSLLKHLARANPSDGGGAFRFSPDCGNCSNGGGAPKRRIFETTLSRDAYWSSWTKPSEPAKNSRPSRVEADAVKVVSFDAENSVGTTLNLPRGSD
jgi:hypothetical protein